MAIKVIGIHVSSFIDKKTGGTVAFVRLFVVCPADRNEKGMKDGVAEAIKVRPGVAAQAPVGSEIQSRYDKYDNIYAFDVVLPAK